MLLVALAPVLAASVAVNRKTIEGSSVSINRRVLAWVVVLCHDALYTLVIGAIVYFLFKRKRKVLLALNITISTSIGLFLFLKICVLTLWFNTLLGLPRYRLYTYAPAGLFGTDATVDSTGGKNYMLWTRSYLCLVAVLLVLNSATHKT